VQFRKTIPSILLALVTISQVGASDSFDVLTSRFSGVTGALRSTAFAVGVYVTVGDGGTILTSTDSITWVPRLSGTTNRLNSVRYGNSGFVAVGEGAPQDPSTILKSVDGINWIRCTSPVTNVLNAVCHVSGRYLAVGSGGMIVTSTNALDWDSISTGAPYDLNGVDGTIDIYDTTTDTFTAVGDSGLILTSHDGFAWTGRFSGLYGRLNAVFGSSLLVGDSGTVAVSNDDGVTWTKVSSGATANLYGINTDTNGRTVVVGAAGIFSVIGYPTRLLSQTSNTTNDLHGVVYANGNFLAVGDKGTVQAGTAWIPYNAGTSPALSNLCYGNGTFVAVGAHGAISTSTDGMHWTQRPSGVTNNLNQVCYGKNQFVAVGNAATILTSTDAIRWAKHTATTNDLQAVAFGIGFNGIEFYVASGIAVGTGFTVPTTGFTIRSGDGTNWTGSTQLTFPGANYYPQVANAGLAFATNFFAAIYNRNTPTVLTSPSGISWTLATNVPYLPALPMAYGESGYVSVPVEETIPYPYLPAQFRGIWTSADNLNWAWRSIDNDVLSVAYGNGSYVLLCDGGVVRITTPLQPRPPLLAGRAVADGFELSMTAQPGYTYSLQRTAGLLNPAWINVYSFTSTQAVTTFLDSDATNHSASLYRLTYP
jgi:hypothetical protein